DRRRSHGLTGFRIEKKDRKAATVEIASYLNQTRPLFEFHELFGCHVLRRTATRFVQCHDSSPHTPSITPGYIAASCFTGLSNLAHSKQKMPPSGSTC